MSKLYDTDWEEPQSTPWCECEHKDHAANEGLPDGPQHPYGLGTTPLAPVETIYGTFQICAACRQHHPIPPEMLRIAADNELVRLAELVDPDFPDL